jgi:GTP-binding protein EngB required for normal cell division|tara:strand:+ start:286 stop:516 length:231 start_codon:yes stop_codon:yes gene_type:complete
MKTKQKEQIIKNALLAYERELKRDLKELSKKADKIKKSDYNKTTKDSELLEISQDVSWLISQSRQTQILFRKLSNY